MAGEDLQAVLQGQELAEDAVVQHGGLEHRATGLVPLGNMEAVQFHAARTEHSDFGESEQEVAPLTDEQKARMAAECAP